MTDDRIAEMFGSWAVVKTAQGFDVQRLPFSALAGGNVLAAHPSEESARAGLQRMELGLPLLIREFEKSIAHEIEIRNRMIAAFHAFAKPRAEDDAPPG